LNFAFWNVDFPNFDLEQKFRSLPNYLTNFGRKFRFVPAFRPKFLFLAKLEFVVNILIFGQHFDQLLTNKLFWSISGNRQIAP